MLAGADTPHPTDCHGCSPVRATDTSLASIRDSELPSGLYKNNGKPTIDRNFFKAMAKTIKGNRPAIADVDVVDETACLHYTGCYTSTSSCGEKTWNVYTSWIEGHAMHVRIDLKFRMLHERMRAFEASNDPNSEMKPSNNLIFY